MTVEQPSTDLTTLPPGMHPAMLPPQPPEEPPRRGEGLLIAAATVIGAIVVLAGLIGFQQLRSDGNEVAADVAGDNAEDDAASEDSQPETTAPTTTSPEVEQDQDDGSAPETESDTAELTVDIVACPAEYDEVICDAAAFVQEARGRPFKEFPVIELLGDAEFDDAVLDDFEEYESDLTDDERVLKALGLLPADLDLPDTYRSLLEVGVLGFYDPEIQRLVVRGGEFDLFGQAILVHELVHAFDDQWFDLDRPDFPNADQEYGFLAVVEGNASRVEDQWRDQLSAEDKETLAVQEFGSLSLEDLNRLRALPEIILLRQASPYNDGQAYVERMEEVGGEQAIDDSLTVPPRSSEEILHEGNLFEDELAIVDVPVPAVDGSIIGEGTLGELLISFWLDDPAAAGWGGDRYAVFEDGENICLTVDLAADTPTDLLEFETAAAQWQSTAPDLRTVSTLSTADRTLVRVTGCY